MVIMNKDNWRSEKAKAQKRNTNGEFIKEEDYGKERTSGYSVSTRPKRKAEPSKNCIDFFKRMVRLRRQNKKRR